MTFLHAMEKEFRLLFRDRAAVLLGLALPAIAIYVFSLLGMRSMRLGTTDPNALILAFAIAFPALMSSSTAIVRERAQGTLNRLSKAPAPLVQLIGGKLAANSAFAVLQALVALLVAASVLDALSGTDLVAIFAVLVLFGIVSHAFGILISSAAKSDGQAAQLVAVSLLVMIVLSGFLKRIDELGTPLEALARILPFTQGYHALFYLLDQDLLSYGWLGAMLGTTAVCTGLSAVLLRFRRR